MKKRVGEQRKYNKGLIFQNPHLWDSSISNPRSTLSHSELIQRYSLGNNFEKKQYFVIIIGPRYWKNVCQIYKNLPFLLHVSKENAKILQGS